MKKLSIEEKACRYDEAIKKVNDYYEGKTKLYSNVDKTLDYLFPELIDEDERIRKAIINVFATHKYYEMFFGVSVEDILAWLEKQGEQKLVEENYNLKEKYGESKEFEKIDSYCQEHCKGYQETGRCFADGGCRAKEDENMLDRAIYMMEQLDMTESWDDVYNWLKSLPERLS